MDVLSTPAAAFERVPDFPHAPRLVEVTAPGAPPVRIAAIDEGPRDAPVALLLHSIPAWSFAWRAVIPALVGAGLRVVALDLVGAGRSDKPARPEDHTFARHRAWLRAALDALGVGRATLAAQGWGASLGLSLLVDEPDRLDGAVVANLWMPTGEPLPQPILDYRAFVAAAPVLPVGFVIAAGTWRGIDPARIAAYDAPFPDEAYKAAARAFPLMQADAPDAPMAEEHRRIRAALARFERPFLPIYGDADLTAPADGWRWVPGARPPRRLDKAGYWLLEDASDEVARAILELAPATR